MIVCDAQRKAAFETLRPLCVRLSKDHTRKNVQAVSSAVDSVHRVILQELQTYLLFPIRIILKSPTKYSEDLYTDVLLYLEKILMMTHISSWETFGELFTTACVMISSPSSPKDLSNVKSEELKLAIVKTLTVMINSCDFSILQKLFTIQNLPMLGHAVSVLLNLAEMEKARHLKIAAMLCIVELSQVDGEYCSRVKAMLGDTFASFLPGISITMCRIITGDSKQGHNVLATAVTTWTKIMHLVMDDMWLEESQAKRKLTAEIENCTDEKLKSLSVHRTADWVKTTDEKLTVIVKQISKVKGHSSWKVRTALLELAGTLIQTCIKSLQHCLPDLLEILVGLLIDEYPNIAATSRKYLELFSRNNMTSQCRPLVEMIEENLYKLSLSLPRQMRSVDEDQKYSTVSLLSGYISLLGPHLNSMLRTRSHIKRLSLALVQILELDCTDLKIVEERSRLVQHGSELVGSNHAIDAFQPRKNFKHFHDKRIYQELLNVCRLLGYYGDMSLLVDHFLDIFHETILHKMQATLIINEMILGAAGIGVNLHKQDVTRHSKIEELEGLIKMLIEEYCNSSNMDLMTGPSAIDTVNCTPENRLVALNFVASNDIVPSVNNFNRNITQICLYLEGIGHFSKVLEKRFLPYLISTLYPLMEKLGEDNSYISSSAYLALIDICNACKFKSLSELIQKNADYLVNAVSLRLRHFNKNSRTPLVLKVILQYSSSDILPLIDDTIQEVLDCLDDHYEEKSALFMGVLNELVKAVQRWFPPIKLQNTDGTCTESRDLTDSLSDYITSYYKLKMVAQGEVTEEDMEDTEKPVEEEEEVEEEAKKEPPKHVIAVKQVMERSKHLLSATSPRLRIQVLETIALSCQALQSHQDVLLPLIHEVWAPFVCRFMDEEKLVTRKAIETLGVMADTSGDFIRHRVSKDVLPKLMSFLQKQALISAGSSRPYLFTVNYKLQTAVLSSVGNICHELQFSGNDLFRVMATCVVYLSARQPSVLQQAAVDLLTKLSERNADAIWLLLCNLYNPGLTSPRNPDFNEVKFSDVPGVRNEYTDNVMRLLELPTMKSCHLSG